MMTDERYNELLGSYAAQTQASLDARLPSTDSRVCEAMRYSLLGGGKRIRAVMTLAACALCGGDMQSALDAACAVEMLHCYSLIHDDLPCMDDDALRRGKPSCHIVYGEANALLAGDALQTAAFEALAHIAQPDICADCVQLLARAAGREGMVYGQELDIYYEDRPADTAALETIDRHKTGALIEASLLMGAACARASGDDRAALRRYAAGVGAAFQITDDVLDVTSLDDVLGKPTGSDERNGKTTFVTLLGVEGAREAARTYTHGAQDALTARFGARADFLVTLSEKLAIRAK